MDENERRSRDTKIDVLNMYLDKVNNLMTGADESTPEYAAFVARKQAILDEIATLQALG